MTPLHGFFIFPRHLSITLLYLHIFQNVYVPTFSMLRRLCSHASWLRRRVSRQPNSEFKVPPLPDFNRQLLALLTELKWAGVPYTSYGSGREPWTPPVDNPSYWPLTPKWGGVKRKQSPKPTSQSRIMSQARKEWKLQLIKAANSNPEYPFVTEEEHAFRLVAVPREPRSLFKERTPSFNLGQVEGKMSLKRKRGNEEYPDDDDYDRVYSPNKRIKIQA